MNHPRPPEAELTPNTSSAAISVRHENAQPILKPVRMEQNAAGMSMDVTYPNPRSPAFRPTMRIVLLTAMNPECVLSATGQRTEWTRTKMSPAARRVHGEVGRWRLHPCAGNRQATRRSFGQPDRR